MSGTDPDGGGGRETKSRAPADPEGGDAACWLDRVCTECGAIQDIAPFDRCSRCGAEAEAG
ncbi:hypothetical protein [Streptomyces sp. NPDC005322]|uniref:hypothetical protein n=1 Tax=unclassified Streptomyces TaxID=2593676 RepID=UPI0033B0CBC7